ncbi:DUF1572 family protein [Paenibacillus nicotianae]|uniref:DUF1572 family protein n=1 Tax=Paenibacillus nicotianae TaxID=1526551 RepID=A0ABW4UVT7_9BACL
MDIYTNILSSTRKQFLYYKTLGDKAMAQLEENQLFMIPNEESNSIAMIVKHLWGNMLSRWTEIFTTDGEKEWRNRDAEFENDLVTAADVISKWEEGWQCLFNTLDQVKPQQLEQIIYIRNEGHTLLEAINRQLAHYPYHVGQIVYIAKMLKTSEWTSLSIPRKSSATYNQNKFEQEKGIRHFTDSELKQ